MKLLSGAAAPSLVVIKLVKPMILACLAQAAFRALADRHLQPPSATNAAPPTPLPGQLTQLALLHIHQYLVVWAVLQSVLDDFQVGHPISTLHDDVLIQPAQGILVES